ncbi:MAG: SMP-30/gluconolactonase/LRE family protein [Cyanobacteria bacterium J06606_4]
MIGQMMQAIATQIEIHDSKMTELVDAQASLILLDDSCEHTEGPVYIPERDSVIWSDTKGDRVLQWHNGKVSDFRAPARYQNGNAIDLDGAIVACSHRDRAITRQDKNGEWHILVDSYQGKRLNSPNDLVVKSDGTLWFSDPPFGLTNPQEGCGGQQEQFGSYVFRFDPKTGDITPVITEMERPNGLVFSPDERTLYVSDTSAVVSPQLHHHILAYRIVDGRSAVEGRVFAVVEPGEPDGMCVDEQGNLFTSSEDSVQIYNPAGTRLGKIMVPEVCANLTFGGKEKNQLFITAGKSLYTIELKTKAP